MTKHSPFTIIHDMYRLLREVQQIIDDPFGSDRRKQYDIEVLRDAIQTATGYAAYMFEFELGAEASSAIVSNADQVKIGALLKHEESMRGGRGACV